MGQSQPLPDWSSRDERELERLYRGDDERLARAALLGLRQRRDDQLRTRASRGCGGDAERVEEAMQRLDVRLWEKRRQYDPAKGPWIKWVRHVLANVIIDLFRERSRLPGAAPPAPAGEDAGPADPMDRFPDKGPPPDHGIKLEELQEAMRDCLGRLLPEQRQALILQVLEDRSLGEIAEETTARRGTVGTRAYRAKTKMQECLKRKGYDGGAL